jgi:hypothetical protein
MLNREQAQGGDEVGLYLKAGYLNPSSLGLDA